MIISDLYLEYDFNLLYYQIYLLVTRQIQNQVHIDFLQDYYSILLDSIP